MPSGKVKERSYDLIPERWYTGKLLEVTERPAGTSKRLKWKFEIIEPEQATGTDPSTSETVDVETAGRWVWGECWPDLDQSDGCVWRRWQEALADRQFGIDDDIDTDDVVGNMAQFKITHRSYEKDGETKWVAEIPDDPEAIKSISVDLSDDPPF